MTDATIVLITLVIYKITLLLIGFWANKRTRNSEDFYLGGRQLGRWVAAISASASSSSAWTLLGVSGAAYLWGLSAIWLLPSVLAGFLFNWLWLAPRIHRLGHRSSAVTLTDLLVADSRDPLVPLIRKVATLIIVFSFTFYIAAQFKGAGTSFDTVFDLGFESSILLGAVIIMMYTLLGGFWAVSVTDTLQGLLMAFTAIVIPIACLFHIGGFSPLIDHFSNLATIDGQWFGEFAGISALGFVIGLLGIANGYPGQPHVVNRFMALKNEVEVKHAKTIALTWAVVVYIGMLLLGWSARLFVTALDNNEAIFFAATEQLFSPVVAGIMIAAVLSAVMSTADSQILVVSSSVSFDNRRAGEKEKVSLIKGRLAVMGVCVAAAALAIFLDDSIFNRVLFAWHAVGSAFGPIVILRALGRDIQAKGVLFSLFLGFGLTVFINHYPNLPGDLAERWIPFIVALVVAWAYSVKGKIPKES